MLTKNLCAATALALAGAFSVSAQSHSGTLPVLYVNTENNQEITTKEYYLQATYYLDNNGDESIESIGAPDDLQAVEIKARGNYTWTGFDKKPYKLKFPKKIEFMGMDKNKHFALLAHADDNRGFMRNIAGFELSRRLGLAWTPQDKPVEFYLNGDYKGLYFVTQTIRVDKTRVNITEQDDNATTDVDGGWLVEIDNYDTDPHIDVTEHNGYPIYFTYKSPEILSTEQHDYLSTQLNAMNDAIYADDKQSTEWLDYIDLESAARYYIVQEILDDCESYHGSCYIHKDRGEGEKWHFGPVWDFGNTFQRGDKSKFVWEDPEFNQTWIGEIYKFPAFQDKVKEVWSEFCKSGYNGFEKYLTDYASYYADGAASDFTRWPQYGQENLTGRVDEFIRMVRKSVNWLGEQWGAKPGEDPSEEVALYVRGEFNNWSVSHPLTKIGDGRYSIEALKPGMSAGQEFKIASEDWETIDLGSPEENMTPDLNIAFSLTEKGKNILVPPGLTENHLMIVDTNAKTLLFTTESGIVTAGSDIFGETPEIYTITGRKVESMDAKGIYLLRYSDRTVKVIK